MKKIYILLIVIGLPFYAFSQANSNIDEEKAAIKAVIEKETNASQARGYDSWATLIKARQSTFTQDESFYYAGAWKNGYNIVKGWDNFRPTPEVLDSLINDAPPPVEAPYKVEYKNYKIKVYSECALAYYDEDHFDNNGELLRHVDCVRFLEKIDGEWKINFLFYLLATSYEVADEGTE